MERVHASLSIQHKLLSEKRDEIDRARDAIERIQFLLQQGHELDWSIISPLLHSMKHEEEHKEWMKEYFSEELVNKVYSLTKEERQTLDLEWLDLLAKIRSLVQNKVSPQSSEAKEALVHLTELVFKQIDKKELAEEFAKQLEQHHEEISADMDNFSFPNFFTKEEQEYIEQVSKVLEKENKK